MSRNTTPWDVRRSRIGKALLLAFGRRSTWRAALLVWGVSMILKGHTFGLRPQASPLASGGSSLVNRWSLAREATLLVSGGRSAGERMPFGRASLMVVKL